MPEEAAISTATAGEVVFSGRWRLDLQHPSGEGVAMRCRPLEGRICLRDGGVLSWDSSLPIAVGRVCRECLAAGVQIDCSALPAGVVKLLELTGGNSAPSAPATYRRRRLVQHFGFFGIQAWQTFMQVAEFTGEIATGLWRCVRLSSRMRLSDLRRELVNCGPAAVPIVALISFLMGLILAFIGAIPLKWFQAESYVASLVGIGMLRLMAPVMVGIVMAGRTGAAYAAELGTMTVNEEVDALRTLGFPPTDFLVMPRFLALTVMSPLLCVFADLVSVLGGAVVAIAYLGITPLAYFSTLNATTRPNDLLIGLFTALVLGMLDAICGCYQGIQCGRSAAAVGRSTTAAVVCSIICIVIATSLITVMSVVLAI